MASFKAMHCCRRLVNAQANTNILQFRVHLCLRESVPLYIILAIFRVQVAAIVRLYPGEGNVGTIYCNGTIDEEAHERVDDMISSPLAVTALVLVPAPPPVYLV